MDQGVQSVIEVETAIGARGLHFRLRELDGERRLLADFDLEPADAFAMFGGSCRRVVGRRADMDGAARITQLLDRLTSADGEETERSIEQIVEQLAPAFTIDDEQLRLALIEELR